jgi:glycine/D-amino acid oxidase-like deaminating enzyme
LISALTVAASGRSVILVEAEQPGWAASGRNAGQVIPMMWGAHKTAAFVTGKLGAQRSIRLNTAIAAAGRTLFSLIAEHQIECDARPGYISVVRTEKSWLKWQQNFLQWREFGGQFEVLDRTALKRYVNSSRYAGGFLLSDGGQLNPLAFVNGLAMAVVRAGGRIFGSSRATAVKREGSQWRIEAGRGGVRCKTVLVGCGAYADGLFPVLRKIGIPISCGMIATEPLPDGGKSILPGRLPCADMDDSAVFSPAIDSTGALVMSYLLGPRSPSVTGAATVVGRRLLRAFPHLPAPAVRRIWAGRFLVSPDGMPALWRLDRDVYAATGCNGLGHSLGVTAALELAKLATGVPEAEVMLPVQKPKPTSGAALMPAIMRGVIFPLLNRLGA